MKDKELLISKRKKFGYEIFDLDGEISYEDSKKIEEALRTDMGEGARNVILNLEKVPYVNSSALSLLVKTVTELSGRETRVYLMNLNSHVMGLIQMTGLNRLFEIIPDEQHLTKQMKRKDVDEILNDV